LPLGRLEQLPVPRLRVVGVALDPGIAEVMRLVDDDDVRARADTFEVLCNLPAPQQVGVVEDFELAVLAEQVGQALSKGALPDRFASGLRYEERHLQSVMDDQPLDEHQPDIGLAEAHAVTKESAAVAVCALQQRVVALPLVGREDLVHGRVVSLPFRCGQFMALEVLVQRFGVHLEGRVIDDMPLDRPQ
jgi:hypothetical protein